MHSSKKHILLIVSSMQGGGAERVAALLCNNWVTRGYRVTLLPTFSGRGGCIYPLDKKVRVVFLADLVGDGRNLILNRINRFIVLRKFLRQTKPDVAISFLTHINVVTIFAAIGLKIPVYVSERSYPALEPISWLLKVLRKFTYQFAENVVIQTQDGKQWIEQHCENASVSVIPNPVVLPLPQSEPEVSPEKWSHEDRYMLVAAGRLEKEKQFLLLMSTFSRLSTMCPNWDLVILGEGNQREELEILRNEYGLCDRVFIPGRVGNLAEWYQCADLFVMSSEYEGFPNALLEAMAYGLPVVSFECKTGPSEIITHGVNGLLVPPASGIDGLASSLLYLMKNDTLREKVGLNALSVQENFSMEKISALWEELIFPSLK